RRNCESRRNYEPRPCHSTSQYLSGRMVEPLPPGHLLVLRPRRPDPTPPARAFPPSRARRSRGRPSISPLVGAVSLIAAALLLLAQSAAATQDRYPLAPLQHEPYALRPPHPHPHDTSHPTSHLQHLQHA